MTTAIQCLPSPQLTDPDIKNLTTANAVLTLSSKYLQHISSTSAGRQLTIADKVSFQVYNAGSLDITLVFPNGVADAVLQGGETITASYDRETSQHVVQRTSGSSVATTPATVDNDPDIRTLTGNLDLPSDAKYFQRLEGLGGYTVTVPVGQSHRIYNSSPGANLIVLQGPTGPLPAESLAAGATMLVNYDSDTLTHSYEVQAVSSSAYSTYAAARAGKTTKGLFVDLSGRNGPADGGEGRFLDIGSTTELPTITDDGGYHLLTTDGRVLRRQGPLEPKHYGATPYPSVADGATIRAASSDHVALQAWFDAHSTHGALVNIPGRDQYKSDSTLNAASRHPAIELDGTLWFSKSRIPGVVLTDSRDADEKLEGSLRHRIRVFRDAGTSRNDPLWLTHDFAETSDGATNGGGFTLQQSLWSETDIGLQCVAVKESEIVIEARNFAIGCAIDTSLSQGATGYTSRSHFRPTVMYNNKVDFHIRARGDDAWANEITVGARNVNLERSALAINTKSVYGFVVQGDPNVAPGSRHIPDGIDLLGSFENTNHLTSPESIVAVIFDGAGIACDFRNDLGTLQMLKVADETRNRNIKLVTEKFHGYDQVDVQSGGDFEWRIDGRTRESTTLVDARNVRQLIVPADDNNWRVKGPHLAFQFSTPQDTMPTADLAIVDEAHIDNYDSPTRPVGGIGAMIELGESSLGGYIQVHPFKDDSASVAPGRITVHAYDSAGLTLTPDTGDNWTVRDCADSPGQLSTYTVALTNVSVRPFDIDNDRSYRLRFAPNVAKVFIAVSSDKLEGFTLTAVDYPGCRVVRQGFDGYIADQPPTHGIFTEPITIINSDPNATDQGWRIGGALYPLLGAHDWAPDEVTSLGKFFKVNPAGDVWEITTVGSPALTAGTAPSGTGPTQTDGNGNVYTIRTEMAAKWTVISSQA